MMNNILTAMWLLPLLTAASPMPMPQSGGVGTPAGTRNDLQNNICRNYTLIFARGTFESGNLGSIIGPPLVTALTNTLGATNLAVQGVNYPADAQGNVPGLETQGEDNYAMFVRKAETLCNGTQIVVGGYSQGASVVHEGTALLNPAEAGMVKGYVFFGDPYKSQALPNTPASKVKEFCAKGDPVCQNGVDVAAHLSYGMPPTPSDAAAFLVGKLAR